MSEPDPCSVKLIGGRLCLDFVNTVDCRNSDHSRDILSTYANLVLWSQHASVLTENEAADLLRRAALHPEEAEKILERTVAVREALYRIFSAIANRQPQAALDVDLLNAERSAAMAQLRLRSADAPRAWTYSFEHGRPYRILWTVVRSAAELLTSDKLDRICECLGENCGWLFLDMSRNRSRKWCDMKDCGNRAKARRHYQMKRASTHGVPFRESGGPDGN